MNKELIANLRGENLNCECAAQSYGECCCDTNWPESYCNAAADALEEAERKLAIAREALRLAGDEPNLDKARKIADAALAQIGEKQ